MAEGDPAKMRKDLTVAEIGAVAHLYRGEVYRSTIWRQRLDMTTNWAVVSTGIALSVSFASAQASPLPIALVGFLTMLFLALEARRYRYFTVWKFRARLLELNDGGARLLELLCCKVDHFQLLYCEPPLLKLRHCELCHLQLRGRVATAFELCCRIPNATQFGGFAPGVPHLRP